MPVDVPDYQLVVTTDRGNSVVVGAEIDAIDGGGMMFGECNGITVVSKQLM